MKFSYYWLLMGGRWQAPSTVGGRHVDHGSSIMPKGCTFGAYGHQKIYFGAMATRGTIFGHRKAAKGRSSAVNSWRCLSLTANGRWASAVYGKKSCALHIDRHRRRGLRVVKAEGTSFSVMAAARRRLQTENMGEGGQSFIVVSGTTLVKRYLFRRVSIIGMILPTEPYSRSCHAKQRNTAKSWCLVHPGTRYWPMTNTRWKVQAFGFRGQRDASPLLQGSLSSSCRYTSMYKSPTCCQYYLTSLIY